MFLQLDDRCKERLKKQLELALSDIIVEHGRLIDFNTTDKLRDLEAIIPMNQKDRLANLISDTPLYSFFYDRLDFHLKRRSSLSFLPDTKLLSEIFENLSELAETLISDLNLLPFDYKFILPLTKSFQYEGEVSLEFSSSLRIVELGAISEYIIPQPDKSSTQEVIINSFLGVSEPVNVKQQFLVYSFKGFVPHYSESVTLHRLISDIKSFFGAALALGLFSLNGFIPRKIPEIKAFLFHSETGRDFRKINFNRFECETFTKLSISRPMVKKPTDLKRGMFAQEKDSDYFVNETWLKERLKLLTNLFSSSQCNARLIRACQWYFDSLCSPTDILSFIQATTTLEILLGDKKPNPEIGVTALLKNRCAFFLGVNEKEREDISREFDALYETRSKILHTGKSYLSQDEQVSLKKLQKICRRIIEREIQFLNR